MARKSFLVNGEKFATKTALVSRIRGILACGVGEVPLDDQPFLLDLFKRHQDAAAKFGVGVATIRVALAKPYNTRCFEIERADGSRTDISYLECLRASTVYDWFPAACRTAVVSQIWATKEAAFTKLPTIACPITGDEVTRATCHVDHAPPWPFEDIVQAFIDHAGIELGLVEFLDGDGETESRFADKELADAFAKFHAERAALRVVSKRANLSILRKGARQ